MRVAVYLGHLSVMKKIVKFLNFSLDHLKLLYLRTLLSAISLFIPEYFCLQIITQDYERKDLLVYVTVQWFPDSNSVQDGCVAKPRIELHVN